ncbi:hypothetical protein E0H64_17730 [Rhizobium leguminosarum bv. viciae]|uniref:hypothetical protein n=1 Tax=Rhizobium TaxID=379 RepID=UPI00103B27EE|nr:hypothetical protein [Rhizobium leguminosarum]TBZ67840.1 hypothetical protein E0H64_17730 [Rhizobium leguminosarum bv. viciae]
MTGFWTAPRCWVGETVFVLASGPSVKSLDLSLLTGRRVIAVKSSWLTYPAADVLFFADGRWWQDPALRPKAFEGLIVSSAKEISDPRVKLVHKIEPGDLSERPDTVALRRTSTTGAINLAVHFGASRIVLLGVDAKVANGGARHAHGRPWPWPLKAGCFDEQAAEYRQIAPSAARLGVEIVNANPDSAIDVWPRRPFSECL